MKTLRLLLLLLVVLRLAPAARAQEQKPTIVGGTPITVAQAPWQVLLFSGNQDNCGGSLIGSGWVLTAAHCVQGLRASDIKVYAGITLRSQKGAGQMLDVDQIILHPNYDSNYNGVGGLSNDVALLRLSSPVSLNANVQIVSYAGPATVNAGLTNPGIAGTISGWGRLSTSGGQPDQLQQVGALLQSNSLAINQYGSSYNATTMLPAGASGSGTGVCYGDSGGPLTVRDASNVPILVGVTSWGFGGCASPSYTQLYARVSNYSTWIASAMASALVWTPCGQNIAVCSDQCVSYGGLPAVIKGRVLADENSPEYNTYKNSTAPFAQGYEKEWVQWQYSYDNVNFYNIDGNATSKDFQPWACYATTYYRRVSTHRVYNTFSSPREYWYTSNVVTITPSSPPATPMQSTYYVCGGGSFVINFTPGTAATSSNWSLPNYDWTVNGGHGIIYNYAYNVGSVTSVTISVPVNVAPGSYEIHTSSNGPCGTAGYRSITVVVGQATPSTITGKQTVYFGTSQRYTLSGSNSNLNWTVPYGWRITGGQGTNSITAVSPGYETYDPFQVTFTDACGSAASAELYVDNIPRPECRYCEPVRTTVTAEEQGIFPNPAIGEVTISSEGQEAEATFYDARGKARKVVHLRTDASLNKVSVRDLPNGLYYVRIVGADRKTVDHQLIIQH